MSRDVKWAICDAFSDGIPDVFCVPSLNACSTRFEAFDCTNTSFASILLFNVSNILFISIDRLFIDCMRTAMSDLDAISWKPCSTNSFKRSPHIPKASWRACIAFNYCSVDSTAFISIIASSDCRTSFLVDDKDIELSERDKEEKKANVDSSTSFNLAAIAGLIERSSSMVSSISLESNEDDLFFLNVLPISRRCSRQAEWASSEVSVASMQQIQSYR